MNFWKVKQRLENEESDYGSMHLNETPSVFCMASPPQSSVQVFATQWLDRSYEASSISLVEYRTRLQELKHSVRLGLDSASTCTGGIITSLKQLLSSGWLNQRWYLISTDCDHFASEAWERSFACSYRNAQCILSALFRLPDFRKRLFGALSVMPSVWKLQALLESAWSLGFDPVGAAELAVIIGSPNAETLVERASSGVASSTRNLIGLVDSMAWLGTSDLIALFGSIGVRCSMLEFRSPGPDGTHPKLLEQVYSYLSVGRSTACSPDAYSVPMILQREGHSQIVIGVEVDHNHQPTALISLDPNTHVDVARELSRAANLSNSVHSLDEALVHLSSSSYNLLDILGSLRIDVAALNYPQYQLLQFTGLIETESDLQDAMIPENSTIVIS